MKTSSFQRLVLCALLLVTAVTSVRSDGQMKADYFNRQSSTVAYPASRVFETVSAYSSLSCGMLCEYHETCQAFTYIKVTNTCQLVDQPLSDADLISNGLVIDNCKTFIKASAQVDSGVKNPCNDGTTDQSKPGPCTDPEYDDYDGLSCSLHNHNEVNAYLNVDGDALMFLNDSTFVYCNESKSGSRFDYHRGQFCDPAKPLSEVDPGGYFECGPPDAAVQNGTHYLLFKGDMVYQYRNSTTMPFITVCDNINCWANKTIKEHFGDWAPTHLDAALSDKSEIYLIKGNLVYTASGNSSVHTDFSEMPCNVTAAGRASTDMLYFIRNNEIYDSTLTYNGLTCFN